MEPIYSGHALLRTPLYSRQHFLEPTSNFLLRFTSLYWIPPFTGHIFREPMVSAIERFHCTLSKSLQPLSCSYYPTKSVLTPTKSVLPLKVCTLKVCHLRKKVSPGKIPQNRDAHEDLSVKSVFALDIIPFVAINGHFSKIVWLLWRFWSFVSPYYTVDIFLSLVGYSRSRTVPYDHLQLLQRGSWNHYCLRCYRPGEQSSSGSKLNAIYGSNLYLSVYAAHTCIRQAIY